MNKRALTSGLNRLYADRVELVEKYTIIVYSKGREEDIDEFLIECSNLGFLKIIKSIQDAEEQEYCIKLLSQIILV